MKNQTIKTKSVSIRSMIHPPFARGIASALDLFGCVTVFDIHLTDDKIDQKALKSDWEAIGRDMTIAIKKEEALKSV